MRLAESLLRSTPFRLALSFAALVILAFLLSGGIVYQTMSANLNRRLDDSVRQAYSMIATTYAESDVDDLITAVNSHANGSSGNDQLISLTGPQGESLAGNLSAIDLPLGFATVPEGTPGFPDTAPYRAYSGKVGSADLTVAQSFTETEELEGLLLASFAWAAIIVAGLAIAGGAYLASRVQRRLDAIGDTMVAVSHGKLDARIPQLGRDDDIDAVSIQINAALDRLGSLVEGMRQVSSDIAHDLKTPLNRLHMILDSAADKAGRCEDVSADLAEARAESSQIDETFDALLRIAQIEAGARKARFVQLDLAEVVASVAEIYAEVAKDDGKTLFLERNDADGTITGDRELLTQLFANLIENAIRHTPAGTRIEISVTRQAVGLVVEVRDDGPGIPLQEHEKVFQRLYRLDKSRSMPGTGLGLSLVRAIADLHGAAVSMQPLDPGVAAVVVFPSGTQVSVR
ncbi:ATP-binding protein [Mesorhizobium sp. 1M-11]|uniref:HAMP domain-containing sensor histidine kinase n=1 Tax=Mesorhizobium sp. 1M-11 TaxID=1529006 RepID=UPI0006C76A43|nr:ATP-binding protein [Mesorhizobium sp. 1M-11]